jgi:hypothetical protein
VRNEGKHKTGKIGWKSSYKVQLRKEMDIDGNQGENLKMEGSDMLDSKGGLSSCLQLTKTERHFKTKQLPSL